MSATANATIAPTPSFKRLTQVTALAWLAIIGFDLLMNAGLLARFYHWELPGFLPPMKMFQYIPLGYAAFLLWSITFVWLIRRTGAIGFRAGAAFGAKLGALLGAAAFLGWLSIFAFPVRMLFAWAIDHALTFTLAGAVVGSGLAAPRLRKLTFVVISFVVFCVVVSVVMQYLGLVPAVLKGGGHVGIGWNPNR